METYVTSEGSVQVRPKKQKKVIDLFTSWSSAWSNYEAIIVAQRPELYINFAQYRNLIQSCDKKYIWHSVYAYDCRFRAYLANSKSWKFHHTNTDIYIYITTFDATTLKRGAKQCFRCRSFNHTVHNCPFPATPAVEETKKNPTPRVIRDKWIHKGKEGCHNFQIGRCADAMCRRAHVCKSCRGPEPYNKCRHCH